MKGSTYLRNNIAFRRLTATQFAEFYKTKAFLLGAIIDFNKHDFTATAREILLQYFAVMTDWLEEIECELIRNGNPDADAKERYCQMFVRSVDRIHEIMRDNPNDFEPRFVALWNDLSVQCRETLVRVLRSRIEPEMSACFVNIVDFVIGLLNHILFNLHEVDALLKNSGPAFVYVDRVDVFVLAETAISLVNLRLALYKDCGLLSSGVDLEIKKNVDDRFLSQDSRRQMSYQHIIEQVVMDMNVVGIL